MPPSLALVIPTFNRADLIEETLDSAFAQHRKFEQIIVIDDGSTDDTQQKIAAYGDQIIYVRTANQGVQAARNTGVRLAETEYVTLCDSDDILLPEYASTLLQGLETAPEIDLVYCNFVNFSAESITADKFSQAPEGYFDGAEKVEWLLKGVPELYSRSIAFQPMFPSGSCFRRDFYQSIGGYDEHFKGVGAEDWEFCLRAIDRGQVALCSTALVKIRRHEGNDSASALHMNLGEIRILEYALQHHHSAKAHVQQIRESIQARRIRAFDGAYAAGRLALASEILQQLEAVPGGLKTALKRTVLSCPEPLRTFLWKCSTS